MRIGGSVDEGKKRSVATGTMVNVISASALKRQYVIDTASRN